MKKKILSAAMAMAMVLSLLPMTALAAGEAANLTTLTEVTYYYRNGEKTKNAGAVLGAADALDTLYGWYTNPSTHAVKEGPFNSGMSQWYTSSDKTELAFTNQSPMGFIIKVKGNYSFSDEFVVNRDTRIGAQFAEGIATITFDKGIFIEKGTLMFKNIAEGGGTWPMNTNIILSEPITVSNGGSLILENRSDAYPEETQLDKLVAPEGQAAIVVNGGTVHSACFEIKRADGDDSNTPLIQVDSGELIFEAGIGATSMGFVTETGMPTYDSIITSERTTELDNGSSSAPAVVIASGASATVKGANFESNGTAPIIEVQNGATLKLNNQTDSAFGLHIGESYITAKGENTPAILVKSGGALTIAADTENNVTATNYQQAIELESGAEITVGEAEPITVGGGEEAENYFDNNGIAVLAAGATMDGQPMNAAVLLTDGTVVEGSTTEAPTVTTAEGGQTLVTVPAGGKVTQTGGTVTQMPAGGSVSQTEDDTSVEATTVAATGISLDKTSVTLYSNTTPNTATIAATLTPADATDTVKWTSNDTAVATVDQNGVVTAVGNGQTTITAQAVDANGTDREGISATCQVTVTTYNPPSGGGSSDPTYSISLPSKVTGGEVSLQKRYAEKGETVTITVTPDDGYELDELIVTDSKGNELELTDKGNGKFTFKMPAGRVEIEVSFQEIVVEPDNPFTDVSTSDYYYDAVLWAVENGVTNGTSATTFGPNMAVSRAQMVTFLWRAHGSPEATGTNPFADVSTSDYYYDAVLWAVANGVTNGTSATTFSPDMDVTRAQAVTFQWRAAGSPVVSGSSFGDVATDAYYVNAVTWAVANGITNGTGGNTFSPDVVVSRAQAVTFLYRELG